MQVETPGKLYATVEEYSPFGTATVRLAENGARLSNLAVHGQPVEAGQRVIVDYSSEKPYVRPLTVIADDDQVIATGDKIDEDEPPDFIYGRYTMSDSSAASVYNVGGYAGQNIYWTPPFDETIVVPEGISRVGNDFQVEHGGKYFVTATVGYEALDFPGGFPRDMSLILLWQMYGTSYWTFSAGHSYRRMCLNETTYLMNKSWITQLPELCKFSVVVWINHYAPGGYSVGDPMPGLWKWGKQEGKYPFMDVWRIAPDGVGPRSAKEWWWL
jgi:hypothetical protein